jgi:3-dehydroquinate synthase
VRRSCEIKAQVVAEDERESGRRAILNFGHTFGHAIEHCQGYGEWLHGEAVAAGMIMAAELSGIAADDLARLRSLVAVAGLPAAPPAIPAQAMLNAMGMDKKVLRKQLRFVLLDDLGRAALSDDYDAARLQQILADAAQ